MRGVSGAIEGNSIAGWIRRAAEYRFDEVVRQVVGVLLNVGAEDVPCGADRDTVADLLVGGRVSLASEGE